MKIVKIILGAIGTLLSLIGIIWFFQGINVLPGSFMTGDVHWAIYGGIAVIVGLSLIFWTTRTPGVGKGVASVFGLLLILIGAFSIAQALNVLHTAMSGQVQSAYIGGVLVVIGLLLLLACLRKPRTAAD